MTRFRPTPVLPVLLLSMLAAPAGGCGDDAGAGGNGVPTAGDDAGTDAGGSFFPVAEAEDPCAVAGYVFDGESDCNVVRCPELACECDDDTPGEAGEPGATTPEPALPPQVITLSACVPGNGCLSLADCTRVCDAKLQRTRQACEARIAAAGARSCRSDGDCVSGECREEVVGSLCVDTIGCGQDGHCAEGSACLFDPETLEAAGAQSTALGTCADGSAGSRCYRDGDCVYDKCQGEVCTAGRDGDACASDRNCASGFCRIVPTSLTEASGACVSGAQGGACYDDGDCGDGLHCAGSVCFSGEVGQNCESDEQCESGICVSGRCRGGEPGSVCEQDADCAAGACIGSRCASGGLLSPCYEADDCAGGLSCVRQVCSDGSEYMPCTSDAECSALACVRGACSAGRDGATCEMDDDCASQRCANPAGADPGACTSGAAGAVCVYNGNCVSGTCGFDGACE